MNVHFLWSDERIDEVAINLECSGRSYFKNGYYVPLLSVKQLRDYYEANRSQLCAELADLARQLQEAQAWQPIEDGIVHTDGPEVIYVKDQLLNILGEHYVYLQQGYALCRLVQPASDGAEEAGTNVTND